MAAAFPAKTEAWTYHNPVRIHFGAGARINAKVPTTGRFAVVCTPGGRSRLQADSKLSSLARSKRVVWVDDVVANPDIRQIQARVDDLRRAGINAVIAIGGGSAMDTGKALAVGLGRNVSGNLAELISRPELLREAQALALQTIPTTAGTGSEVTPFATLWNNRSKKKLSLSGAPVFPQAAHVDPDLTLSLPEMVTISSGLDAINQAAESIWNRNANSLTLELAMRALHRGLATLPKLVESPKDLNARSSMMECSLLAGLAISQTRTALCHSISYPLTSHFGVPHGLACAFTMVSVFDLNKSHDDGRIAQTAKVLELHGVEGFRARLADLMRQLGVRSRVLSYLPALEDVKKLAPEMLTPGRADNNLAPVNLKCVLEILENSYVAE